MNESGYLCVRRFARFIELLKQKDFDLYCNVESTNAIIEVSDRFGELNLTKKNTQSQDAINKPTFSDFLESKDQYYANFFATSKVPDMKEMTVHYVKIIQWTLFYYYRGICSWSYYYPFPCVPFASDLTSILDVIFQFDIDEPAKPFDHLFTILPQRSFQLLPECYSSLSIDSQTLDVVRNEKNLFCNCVVVSLFCIF